MLGDGIPTFTFRGDELIGFIWHIYALARIVDAIKDMPELPKEADPMEDQGAQDELIQGWIDELQSLQVRDDGTVVFDERPWLVNCESPNARCGLPRPKWSSNTAGRRPLRFFPN